MTASRPSGACAAPAPTPARPARLSAVLLVLAGLLLTGALVAFPGTMASAAIPSPSVVPAARDGEATVELVSSAPVLAAPGSTVTLTLQVTNGTDTVLDGAQLDLGVAWRPVTSREDLAAWADDGGTSTAGSRQDGAAVDRLAPGDSTRVTMELEVDVLGLSAENPWGPREMSVALTRGDATLDVVHTFLLFAPAGDAPDPVSVSVAAPVTGPAVDPLDPDGYDLALGTATADGGRLTRLLDAAAVTGSSPGMSLAVDPALVAAAAATGDEDAQAWATRLTGAPAVGDDDADAATSASLTSSTLRTAATGEPADVAVLPGYDPDLAAVAHAEPSRADVAAATGGEAALGSAWQRPEGWDLTLAWPDGRPDVATLSAGREASVDQVVVADGLAPDDGAAASARTAVETPSGKVPALVADAGLSSALTTLTDDTDAPTAAEASTRVLADAALVALQQAESGQEDLHLLAALPRDWSPDPALVGAVLGALDEASWADVVPLSETVAAPASRVQRDDPARGERAGRSKGELAPSSVRRLLDAHRDLAAFSTVASDPVELSGDADQALVAPLAVAARTEREARDRAVDLAVEQADALQQGIGVADRSNVTLVSDTGKLPVTVSNDLPVDATVTVVLRPDASRLVVESRPTVVVPAGTATNVHVPVRAIGSGDVTVQVEVLAPSGTVVAGPTSFSLRVRAGWETAGTAVVAVLVALLFLGGIWRTVRRGRSSARTTGEGVAAAAADPQGPDAPAGGDVAAPDRDVPDRDLPDRDLPDRDAGDLPDHPHDPPDDPGGGGAPATRTPPAQATETDPS
ncbi:DUF6049 family protein [Isoptericola sp. NPDC019482]|uniref:DUF6049 family protein n=1 Tax=Isoptericola sp. NPDC019482 TaxID=3154688 RepID=UPI0034974D87